MKWIIKTASHSKGLVQDEINTLVHPHSIQWLFDCIAIVDTDEKQILRIINSSANAKMIFEKPIVMKKDELIRCLKNGKLSFQDLNLDRIDKFSTFVVRHEHTGIIENKLPTEWIEKELGSTILSFRKDLEVNLTNPIVQYRAVSWRNGTCLGWLYAKVSFDRIAARAPKMGPYFRGGGMKPRMCRTLVNLLYPMSPVIVDPFCGHGGILREIADLGSFAVGIEINKKLCRELLANNRHFGFADVIAIIMGDSLRSPLRKNAYNQAVTDPPYAIQTTTKGLDREDLLLQWLKKQTKGLLLVFTTPDNMLLSLSTQWEVNLDHNDFVHKSLTRRIRRAVNRGDEL